ncbi:MAG: hypothetical protein HY821_15155 [Acidobacteria bacterium]|nr:hypothetical protein [Acidobacteriota bacterium]
MRRRNLALTLIYACVSTLVLQAQSPQPPEVRPPVVLLNGLQLPLSLGDILRYGICPVSQSTPPSRNTFGELESVLKAAGHEVLFFDNCVHCPGKSIEECGQALGKFLDESVTAIGTVQTKADLVAHSMGGLIARAYLAGMQTDRTFAPLEKPRVGKVVMLGTPNFGSFWAAGLPALTPQVVEMAPGSDFLFNLATWNNGKDDMRGVDVLSIAGNACPLGTLEAASDGVVSLMSASANFAAEPEKTRVLPYRHTEALGAICGGKPGIASVDGPAHLSAQAVLSFLGGTDEWKTIGQAANEDFYLLRYGAGMAAHAGASRLISGAGIEWTRSQEPNPLNVFYTQMVPSEATDLWFEVGGLWLRYDAVIPVGTTLAINVKK